MSFRRGIEIPVFADQRQADVNDQSNAEGDLQPADAYGHIDLYPRLRDVRRVLFRFHKRRLGLQVMFS